MLLWKIWSMCDCDTELYFFISRKERVIILTSKSIQHASYYTSDSMLQYFQTDYRLPYRSIVHYCSKSCIATASYNLVTFDMMHTVVLWGNDIDILSYAPQHCAYIMVTLSWEDQLFALWSMADPVGNTSMFIHRWPITCLNDSSVLKHITWL